MTTDTLDIVTGITAIIPLACFVIIIVSSLFDFISVKKENKDNLEFYKARTKMESMIKKHEKSVKVKQTIAQCQNASEFVYLNK